MVTVAFGFIVENGAIEWRGLTGGANGMLNIPPPALGGFEFHNRHIALLAILIATLALIAFRAIDRSGLGRAMRAVRASEIASQCLGLNPVSVRITAFALSAAAAGLAGGLFAPLTSFVSPSGFTFFQSILFLLVVIVGGSGTTLGPLAGAIVVVMLPQLLAGLAEYQLLFFGAVLLMVLWLAPDGIVGEVARRFARRSASHVPQAGADVGAFLRRTDGAPLRSRGLGIAFGGVHALAEVDFAAHPGKVTSLIGPNGAGKTTLINLLGGFYRPDGGTISLGERRLDGLAAHRIARAGIARTFQTSQLFAGLSVIDNIRVALRGANPVARMESDEQALAEALLAFVGYGDAVGRPAIDLPHGDRRLVEIARALASRPRALLLDEPAAGLGAADKLSLAGLIRRIADLGIAVVLVEHDMGLVMSISDAVVVLDAGRVIAAGAPAAVQNDPAVRKAYLGDIDYMPAPRGTPYREGVPVLAASGVRAGYGDVEVLHDFALAVHQGELVAVLGANGAGKTTAMRALSGLLRPIGGSIELGGIEIARQPAHRIARSGLALVPEGRQVFFELSVLDNLRLGAYARRDGDIEAEIARLLERFPLLQARAGNRAGLLSGGEQQMLALARGLIAAPRVLLLDEPSLGLAPAVIAQLFAALARLRDDGMTLLLVDQMAGLALALADRAYVIETGRIVHEGAAAEVAGDAALEQAYLGARPARSPGG